MSKINAIPLINQNIFTTHLSDIDNEQIVFDINTYGVPVNGDCQEYGSVSRGFVQYEDTVVPITQEFTKLEQSVIHVVELLTRQAYKIDEIWAITLMPGQSVIAHSHYKNYHTHPGDYFSVAYYPYAPADSADLIFSAHWCGYMHNTISVKPQDGLLIVFNSFITHMTARQMIDVPRIVVSMNLSPTTPRATPNADWSIYANRPVIESAVSPKCD